MLKFLLAALVPLAFALADDAGAAPRHPRAPAFRAQGLLQPITPRVLSHRGPAAKFRSRIPFRAHGLLQSLNPQPERRARRLVRPVLIGLPLLAGPLVVQDGFWYGPAEIAPRPAPAAPAAPAGCVTEDVSVPGAGGQATVSIIRC